MALEIRIKRAEESSTRQLAAEMLADAVGSAPEDIFFYRGENGKPLTNLTLPFNCSHSGGFVVCAVGEREVGVDLEQIRPVHPRLERALTAAERQWLTSLPQAERDEGFFRLWTLKESFDGRSFCCKDRRSFLHRQALSSVFCLHLWAMCWQSVRENKNAEVFPIASAFYLYRSGYMLYFRLYSS